MSPSSLPIFRKDGVLVSFLTGFLPLFGAGIAIALVGGRETLVYCGSLTPYQYVGGPGGPCAQIAFIPNWGGLSLIPLGACLGTLMARLKTLASLTRGS